MKFSDSHPMAQKWPKRAPISLRIQAIFACGRLERKNAKSAKFTENCGKCEKYENEPNFIQMSLDFIRVFAFEDFLSISRKSCEPWRILRKFRKSYIFCGSRIFCKDYVKTIISRFFMSKTSMCKIPYKIQWNIDEI